MNPFTLNKQPSDVMEELSQRLRALRKDAGWTQEACAERSGVSLGSLKRFEQTGHISLESMLKLAHLLGRLSDFDSVFQQKDAKDVNDLFSDFTK